MNYIEELQDVIRQRYSADSRHLETVPIKETLHGKTIWEGNVEVFELIGHPKASKVFAWAYATENPKKPRHVTVLNLGPISSPLYAVRYAILEEAKSKEAKNTGVEGSHDAN
jgi:hypothetical protein